MEYSKIIQKVDRSIRQLLKNEQANLERNISERNLSSHLAFYFKRRFNEFDIDPEYNGSIDYKTNYKKGLEIAEYKINRIKKERNDNNFYRITPDIIIHKRGVDEKNLVVIEVKKDVSESKEKEYDFIILEELTRDHCNNHFNYKLGIALELGTGKNAGKHEIKYFQNGSKVDLNTVLMGDLEL